MSDDYMSDIQQDIDKLNSARNAREEFGKFAKWMLKGTAAVGVGALAIHFAIVNPLYDEQPLLDAQKEMDNGTLVVPPEFFAVYQEKCIRHEIGNNNEMAVNFEAMDSDEIINLKNVYADALQECADQAFQEQEFTQREYVQSFEKNTTFLNIGLNSLSVISMYLGLYGWAAHSRRRTEAKITKRERDRKAFDI